MATAPENKPAHKPPSLRDDAMAVLLRLREAGHIAYFAGGSVRDLLLGKMPTDYDVATNAPPEQVRKLFKNTQAVGQAFGVVLVRIGRSVIEVATFRTDGTYSDGRRPESVVYSTPQQDAQRRDFTLNGLFYDPVAEQVIDYVGGQDDLHNRIIRAIGNPAARFEEDHLRQLRAVRFTARLGFTLEHATADAIRLHAPSLVRISPERIADELRAMLCPATRMVAWKLLWELNLIGPIMRFVQPTADAQLDTGRSLFLALAPDEPIPFGLALLAGMVDFCHQVAGDGWGTLITPSAGQRYVRAARQGLRISNDESDQLLGILKAIDLVFEPYPPTVARKKRFCAHPEYRHARLLLNALARLGYRTDDIHRLIVESDALALTDCNPLPLITGDDLVAAGYAPGPAFKAALEQVYDAQLEFRLADRTAAMRLASTLLTAAS